MSQAAKDIQKSHETLIDIFGHIESFFRRLEIYTQVPSTTEMIDTIIQIMVEVLTILGIATKEIKQGRISEQFIMNVSPVTELCSEKYWKRLIGKTGMEDALKKLDRLTQEEARMIIAENLRATHAVDERVRGVTERVLSVERSSSPTNLIDIGYGALCVISENQLQESIHQLRESIYKWLSPPDPSTNHNIACGTHHKKPATWFFKGNIYREWKSRGSFLW